MCISMELVTAVLGDHGQRPREDYGKGMRDDSPVILAVFDSHSIMQKAFSKK